MPQLEDGNEKVTNSVIPNGTEAKVMRNLIENKGLLKGKGKLYAGTDDTTSTGAPVTTAIDPSGASDGSVLIKKSTEDGGWTVDKINADNLYDNAVTTQKIQDGQVIAAKLGSDIVNTTSKSANGITVTLQQNATTKKLDIGLTSDKVTNATYAQYASEDTSKGTIEERLTSLGFKTGSLEILADDSGRKPSVNLNLIRKEGNVVAVYYSGEKGRASLDSSSLRQNIVGKIPSEFWPSTTPTQRVTELSSAASDLSLLKFNNEWYLQSSSTTADISEIFAYNLKQEPSIDEIQLEYLPEISVPEGVDKTVVTRSLANATDWDLIENIPYVLNANSNNVVVSYDKDTSQTHKEYYGVVPDSTYDTSTYNNSGFLLASRGNISGYNTSLHVVWDKTNRTVSYILSKYNRLNATTEGVATAKLSAFAGDGTKTLSLRGWNIFV